MKIQRTVHDEVVSRIAGWIVGGRFRPGANLPTEPELGAELGVSRTVVREAVKSLAAKGMVATRPRTGTRVRALSDWHLFDPEVLAWTLERPVEKPLAEELVELRHAIEPFAAELAAGRRGPDDLERLEAAFAAMVEGSEGRGSYHEADVAFHKAMLQATANRFLIGLLPMIEGMLRLSFSLSTWTLEEARGSLGLHRDVLETIARGDAPAAREAMRALIVDAREDIIHHLDRSTPRTPGGAGPAALPPDEAAGGSVPRA